MRLKGRLGMSALPLLINSNDLRTTERTPDTLLLCEPGQFRQAFDERFIQCHSTVSVCVLGRLWFEQSQSHCLLLFPVIAMWEMFPAEEPATQYSSHAQVWLLKVKGLQHESCILSQKSEADCRLTCRSSILSE